MRLFSSEQVSKYHPDKYADQISDSIVALAVKTNSNARCAIETMVKDDYVIVAGEINGVNFTDDQIYYEVKKVADELNYKINHFYCLIGQQSNEILNRTCYMMEFEPRYVDVIIKRWEHITNKTAIKL